MTLNEDALNAAQTAVQGEFAKGNGHEARMEAAIRAYLQAVAPKKGIPTSENLHRQFYVERDHDGTWASAGGYEWTNELHIGLHALCGVAHAASLNAGWYSNPVTGRSIDRNVPEMLMLIVSEIAEGMEGVRKGLMDDHLTDRLQIEVELADAVIRIGDLCGYLGLDLAGAVEAKMAYNATREDHKLETRAAAYNATREDHKLETRAAGGKAF